MRSSLTAPFAKCISATISDFNPRLHSLDCREKLTLRCEMKLCERGTVLAILVRSYIATCLCTRQKAGLVLTKHTRLIVIQLYATSIAVV